MSTKRRIDQYLDNYWGPNHILSESLPDPIDVAYPKSWFFIFGPRLDGPGTPNPQFVEIIWIRRHEFCDRI